MTHGKKEPHPFSETRGIAVCLSRKESYFKGTLSKCPNCTCAKKPESKIGSESLVDCCGLLSSPAELLIFCCSGGDRRVTIGDFWGESSRFSVILMQLGSPAPSRRGNRSWRRSQNRPDPRKAARSRRWKSRFFLLQPVLQESHRSSLESPCQGQILV